MLSQLGLCKKYKRKVAATTHWSREKEKTKVVVTTSVGREKRKVPVTTRRSRERREGRLLSQLVSVARKEIFL